MGNISLVAQAICEQDGTVRLITSGSSRPANISLRIDKILEAVDDDDLAQFELPRQLQKLRKISQSCIEDTLAVKEKVKLWEEHVKKIRLACEDENRRLHLPAARLNASSWQVRRSRTRQ
jgi:hypothetical protein